MNYRLNMVVTKTDGSKLLHNGGPIKLNIQIVFLFPVAKI